MFSGQCWQEPGKSSKPWNNRSGNWKKSSSSEAPADLPKAGGRFDLAIEVGFLGASSQVDPRFAGNYEYIGELSLGGDFRSVKGALAAAIQT